MASEDVPGFSQNLTANGGTDGKLTVNDSSGFYPGAYAWLRSSAKTTYCQIVECPDATHVTVRFLPDPGADLASVSTAPSYAGGSDASAFLLADGARLSMFDQVVRVTQPQFSKRSKA